MAIFAEPLEKVKVLSAVNTTLSSARQPLPPYRLIRVIGVGRPLDWGCKPKPHRLGRGGGTFGERMFIFEPEQIAALEVK